MSYKKSHRKASRLRQFLPFERFFFVETAERQGAQNRKGCFRHVFRKTSEARTKSFCQAFYKKLAAGA